MQGRFTLWVSALVDRAHQMKNEDGQALVEYALILGLISVVSITVLTLIGTDVNGILTTVEAALKGVPGA